MKTHFPLKSLLLLLLGSMALCSVHAQNIPVDFEAGGHGAAWSWTVFENDLNPPLEIIANPFPGGINSSATVAKFTALQGGAPFAGCESLHGSDIGTFTIDSTNMIIRIMVYKSVISNVGIKLVRADNWSLGEILVPNTTTNQWEQITFDFSSHLGLTYDQLVIFPDFNARAGDNVIYFDNVFGPEAVATGISVPSVALEVYPNPVQTRFKLEAEQPMQSVQVFSSLGKLVHEAQDLGRFAEIDLAAFPNGVYALQVEIDGQILRKRILKTE